MKRNPRRRSFHGNQLLDVPGERTQVAKPDKDYDSQPLRETLREMDIRPLVKHRVFAPYDHAHNARTNDDLYNQRSMTETVNSSVKRSDSGSVRTRERYRGFREIVLMYFVYNIKQYVIR